MELAVTQLRSSFGVRYRAAPPSVSRVRGRSPLQARASLRRPCAVPDPPSPLQTVTDGTPPPQSGGGGGGGGITHRHPSPSAGHG